MQPPTASVVALIMEKLLEQPRLMNLYLARVARFRSALERMGCVTNQTPSYIVAIFLGEDQKVEPVRRDLSLSTGEI